MRAVVQRVAEAAVIIRGEEVGSIGRGLLVLLGVGENDAEKDAAYLADKIANLRIFSDPADKMNLSVADIGGSVLVVSQFTLWGDCRKGRRPSFIEAARPEQAIPLYEKFIGELKVRDITVATGRFQEMMRVSLINDGPVTILLDSRKLF